MSTHRATLDRIIDGKHAVLLLEGADEVDDELVVEIEALPSEGRTEGAVYDVTVFEDQLEEATYLSESTDRRQKEAQDRLEKLSTPLRERNDDDDDSGSS